MKGQGKIIACELNEERVKRLEQTIKLSGATSILLFTLSAFVLIVLFQVPWRTNLNAS